ncbi:MAG: PHB depolymerase family esterase [Kofleriaceae bacterium]|nr:PHB depolymerase family esterase [Kofleriaceae bacterium]
MRRLGLLIFLSACGFSAGGEQVDAGADETRDAGSSIDARVDAPACGIRSDRRGKTTRTIQAGGLERRYHVYLPASASATMPMPLVYVHHGYTMSGDQMFDITRYARLADAEGIAVAFPDGQGGTLGAPWNVGEGVCGSTAGVVPIAEGDDFAMLDAIRADITEDQCIDSRHVYMTGFSMGGYFSNHAGCMRDDIRAIAPHSGGTHDLAGCASGPKPVIIFHGTADPVIPASCGRSAADTWAARNGCAMTKTERDVDGGTCYSYDGCPAGGQVDICTFTLMGHCWAGGPLSTGIYSCPLYDDATAIEWQFFKTHAW